MGCHGVWALMLGLACGAAGPAHGAPADSCGPSFLDIYDFQPGDIFQDQQTGTSSAGGAWPYTTVVRKYEIVSKERLAQGYRYRVEGRYHRIEKTSPLPYPSLLKHSYGPVDEIREYRDSVGHPLNACRDRIVPIPPLPGNNQVFYTRIRTAIGDRQEFPLSTDTTRLKILGARKTERPGSNLYRNPAGTDSGTLTGGESYSAVYAAGLGCVKLGATSFETGTSRVLDGYARDGDTLGLLSPDEEFFEPVSGTRAAPGAGSASPRAAWNRAGPFFRSRSGAEFRDIKGAVTKGAGGP